MFRSKNINYHNWESIPTQGYKANDKKYLWALPNGTHDIHKEKYNNLIFLGDTKQMKEGDTIGSIQATSNCRTTWDNYMASQTHWGNPFWPQYLNQEKTVLYTTLSPHELREKLPQNSNTWPNLGADFQIPTNSLIQECRYNPYQDTGNNSHILSKNLQMLHKLHGYNQQTLKYKAENTHYGLSTWGFVDYMKNTIGIKVDTDYIVVIVIRIYRT